MRPGLPTLTFVDHALNVAKDAHDFTFQLGKLYRQHRTPRVQDNVHVCTYDRHLPPDDVTHPPLDAITLDRLAQHLARGEANPRTGWRLRARAAKRVEVAHRRRELLAALAIHPLKVGVL